MYQDIRVVIVVMISIIKIVQSFFGILSVLKSIENPITIKIAKIAINNEIFETSANIKKERIIVNTLFTFL
jgi:hypothetical protein